MHNILKTIKASHVLYQLNFDLVWVQPLDGPQPQFWRSTCQVLKKEYLQRPVFQSETVFDTILAVQDIERPDDYTWEVRIKGRIEPLSVGETVDLVGIYHKKQRRPGIPSIVVSVYRHAWHWWPTAEVIREDHPRFRIYPYNDRFGWGYAGEGQNSDHNWLGTSQPEEQARARDRFIALATAIANDRYTQPAKPAAAPPPDDDLNLPPE